MKRLNQSFGLLMFLIIGSQSAQAGLYDDCRKWLSRDSNSNRDAKSVGRGNTGFGADFSGSNEFVLSDAQKKYLTTTKAGWKFVVNVTGVSPDSSRGKALELLTEKMNWQGYRKLRQRLEAKFAELKIQTDPEVGYSKDDLEVLVENAFEDTDLVDKIIEECPICIVRKTAYDKYWKDTKKKIPKLETPTPDTDGAIQLPIRKSPHLDLANLREFEARRLTFWKRLGSRFAGIGNFFGYFRFTDGDFLSLVSDKYGKPFSPADLMRFRKVNDILDHLNHHERFRLMMFAMTNELPNRYSQINVETEIELDDYANGRMSANQLMDARRNAAAKLGLNDIVPETEERIVQTVESLYRLGGGEFGGVKLGGKILSVERAVMDQAAQLPALEKRLERLRLKAKEKLTPMERAALNKELEMVKVDHTDVYRRLKKQIALLRLEYIAFVKGYEVLDLFINLRSGYIGRTLGQAFELPMAWIPSQAQVDAWSKIYDRALENSTNSLLLQEGKGIMIAQVGATRNYVNQLNKWSNTLFGQKFTDTPLGSHLKDFSQGMLHNTLKKGVIYLGSIFTIGTGAQVMPSAVEKQTAVIVREVTKWVSAQADADDAIKADGARINKAVEAIPQDTSKAPVPEAVESADEFPAIIDDSGVGSKIGTPVKTPKNEPAKKPIEGEDDEPGAGDEEL